MKETFSMADNDTEMKLENSALKFNFPTKKLFHGQTVSKSSLTDRPM